MPNLERVIDQIEQDNTIPARNVYEAIQALEHYKGSPRALLRYVEDHGGALIDPDTLETIGGPQIRISHPGSDHSNGYRVSVEIP